MNLENKHEEDDDEFLEYTKEQRATFSKLNIWLVEEFPELDSQFQRELKTWEPDLPGSHVIYGNLLNPYIEKKLEEQDQQALDRVGAFLEKLASAGEANVEILNVLNVTVLEKLLDYKQDHSLGFLGVRSSRLLKAMEEYMDNLAKPD